MKINNFVSKNLFKFNKPKVEVNKKKKLKHNRKITKNSLRNYSGESPFFTKILIWF